MLPAAGDAEAGADVQPAEAAPDELEAASADQDTWWHALLPIEPADTAEAEDAGAYTEAQPGAAEDQGSAGKPVQGPGEDVDARLRAQTEDRAEDSRGSFTAAVADGLDDDGHAAGVCDNAGAAHGSGSECVALQPEQMVMVAPVSDDAGGDFMHAEDVLAAEQTAATAAQATATAPCEGDMPPIDVPLAEADENGVSAGNPVLRDGSATEAAGQPADPGHHDGEAEAGASIDAPDPVAGTTEVSEGLWEHTRAAAMAGAVETDVRTDHADAAAAQRASMSGNDVIMADALAQGATGASAEAAAPPTSVVVDSDAALLAIAVTADAATTLAGEATMNGGAAVEARTADVLVKQDSSRGVTVSAQVAAPHSNAAAVDADPIASDDVVAVTSAAPEGVASTAAPGHYDAGAAANGQQCGEILLPPDAATSLLPVEGNLSQQHGEQALTSAPASFAEPHVGAGLTTPSRFEKPANEPHHAPGTTAGADPHTDVVTWPLQHDTSGEGALGGDTSTAAAAEAVAEHTADADETSTDAGALSLADVHVADGPDGGDTLWLPPSEHCVDQHRWGAGAAEHTADDGQAAAVDAADNAAGHRQPSTRVQEPVPAETDMEPDLLADTGEPSDLATEGSAMIGDRTGAKQGVEGGAEDANVPSRWTAAEKLRPTAHPSPSEANAEYEAVRSCSANADAYNEAAHGDAIASGAEPKRPVPCSDLDNQQVMTAVEPCSDAAGM